MVPQVWFYFSLQFSRHTCLPQKATPPESSSVQATLTVPLGCPAPRNDAGQDGDEGQYQGSVNEATCYFTESYVTDQPQHNQDDGYLR
jgi:hypothetical protein